MQVRRKKDSIPAERRGAEGGGGDGAKEGRARGGSGSEGTKDGGRVLRNGGGGGLDYTDPHQVSWSSSTTYKSKGKCTVAHHTTTVQYRSQYPNNTRLKNIVSTILTRRPVPMSVPKLTPGLVPQSVP